MLTIGFIRSDYTENEIKKDGGKEISQKLKFVIDQNLALKAFLQWVSDCDYAASSMEASFNSWRKE